MERIIKILINEYKKTGNLNLYIVGKEGTGKTILSIQIMERLCKELNIKPNIDMMDIINHITSFKGVNIIETFNDSHYYRYKINVLMKFDNGVLRRGFYKFKTNNIEIVGKFNDKNPYKLEYMKRKRELMEKKLRRFN